MLVCGTSTISEIVAAHLVATGQFSISDVTIVQLPHFRKNMLEMVASGGSHTIVCSGETEESDNINYINQVEYFNDKKVGSLQDPIKTAIKDIVSNSYDMYSSAFNNYIMHDIETINNIAYTGLVNGYAGSASDPSMQLNMWNTVNEQVHLSDIKRPCKELAIMTGNGYVRYMARAMMYNDTDLKIVAFISKGKIYVYFRDGMVPKEYVSAHAWYEGYCEYGQFAAVLSESAVKNLITCMCHRVVESN